jgi:hypothetical protein
MLKHWQHYAFIPQWIKPEKYLSNGQTGLGNAWQPCQIVTQNLQWSR